MRNTLRKCEFAPDMCVRDTSISQICTPEAMSSLGYHYLLLLFLSMSPASGGEHLLSAAEKQELLDVHNYLRSTAIPPATNMERMVSSSRKYACNYTDHCVLSETDSSNTRAFNPARRIRTLVSSVLPHCTIDT